MRFVRDSQQRDMADALRELLASLDVPSTARDWAEGKADPWWRTWDELAAMGVTAVTVPEARGGLGMGEVELVACMEEIGYAGLPGPCVETLAVLPRLLGPLDAAGPQLELIASGTSVASVTLDPHVPLALDADQANAVFVCADGHVRAYDAPALTRQDSFDPARRLFRVDTAGTSPVLDDDAPVSDAFDAGVLACAAQLVGLGRRLLDMSTRHVTHRHQFGRPVGEFQAVKHQLADVLVELDFARPLLHGACVSSRSGDDCRSRDISAAKIAAADAAHAAARAALQVHGAVGYTAEHDLHLWLTKVTALRRSWGTADWHRARVARALAHDPATPIGGDHEAVSG